MICVRLRIGFLLYLFMQKRYWCDYFCQYPHCVALAWIHTILRAVNSNLFILDLAQKAWGWKVVVLNGERGSGGAYNVHQGDGQMTTGSLWYACVCDVQQCASYCWFDDADEANTLSINASIPTS